MHNMGFEIISKNFLYSVIWNPLVYFTLWMHVLPMHEFVTSCIGHLEILVHQVIKNFQILKKSLGNLSSSRWYIQVFQNSGFCMKPQFYHHQQMLLVVFLKVTSFTSLIFKEKSLNKHSLPVMFSSRKSVPKRKQAVQLTTQQLPKSFHSRQPPKCFMQTSHFVLQNVKKATYILQASRFNKVNSF